MVRMSVMYLDMEQQHTFNYKRHKIKISIFILYYVFGILC